MERLPAHKVTDVQVHRIAALQRCVLQACETGASRWIDEVSAQRCSVCQPVANHIPAKNNSLDAWRPVQRVPAAQVEACESLQACAWGCTCCRYLS